MEVVPEYEKIRMKNIEDRRAMMIKHLEEIGVLKKQIISGHAEPRLPATKRRKVRKFLSSLLFRPKKGRL